MYNKETNKPPTIYIKPSALIHISNAEYVFKLLNYHNQELTFSHLVDIQKHSALEKDEEPDPRSKERSMMVSKVTEGLGLTEADIKVFVDNDMSSNRWTNEL